MRRFIPRKLIAVYHRFSAVLADVWYGFPSKKLIVIGVTGTNGKTTTTHFITAILESAGNRVGCISTIVIRVGGKERVNETKMTTLKNCWQIQRLLAEMVASGDTHAVVETTSHALDQYRVHRVRYDVAVLTNVTHEHLDYHKTIEQYRKAKEQLFISVSRRVKKYIQGAFVPRVTVVNADDPSAAQFLRHRVPLRCAYGFATCPHEVEPAHFFGARILKQNQEGSQFETQGAIVQLALPGQFNIANALAALATTTALSIPLALATHALFSIKGVPGRLDRIHEGQPFTVMIDYAVTPDAFTKLAEVIRSNCLPPGRRFWWVFGATGERDRTKRPLLGAIAGRAADFVILTNEDPFHEDPEKILDAVEVGVQQVGKEREKNYWRILDRREAIRYACMHAEPGDVIVITGKGAETAMAIGDTRIAWNEQHIVRELLREKKEAPYITQSFSQPPVRAASGSR